MSDSQNTENEQQNNLCTTLTEQWKKGELPEGDYYIKRRNGYLLYDNIDIQGVWRNSIDEDIEEVLAPVPSYEEWQQLHKFLEEFNALDVAKENQLLKELLKECGKQLYEYSDVCFQEGYEIEREEVLKLKTKVDNAIGEKK